MKRFFIFLLVLPLTFACNESEISKIISKDGLYEYNPNKEFDLKLLIGEWVVNKSYVNENTYATNFSLVFNDDNSVTDKFTDTGNMNYSGMWTIFGKNTIRCDYYLFDDKPIVLCHTYYIINLSAEELIVRRINKDSYTFIFKKKQ
jgi:hypothetical protein